jgi:hypothetical protein
VVVREQPQVILLALVEVALLAVEMELGGRLRRQHVPFFTRLALVVVALLEKVQLVLVLRPARGLLEITQVDMETVVVVRLETLALSR